MAKDDEEIPEKDDETSEEDTSEDESSSEEKSSEEEEDGEEEEEKTSFFDASKVPEALRPTFRQMQAAFTKKMQAFAKEVEMAEAFRELTQIPEFRLWANDMDSGKGYGASSVYARVGSKREEKDGEGDSEEPEEKLSVKSLMKVLGPVIKEAVASEVGPIRRELKERSTKELRSSLPNFDFYYPEIIKMTKRHPTMSEEEAYHLVSGQSQSSSRRVDPKALGKAKKARTEGGDAGKSGVETLTPKTAKTVREALRLGLAEQGIKVE